MNASKGASELDRMQSLRGTGVFNSSPSPSLDDVCEITRERFHVPMAVVKLVGSDTILIKAHAGFELDEVARLGAFTDHTIRSEEVFVVPDAMKDPRFATNPLVTGEIAIRFYAGVPLGYGRDIRLGALCIFDLQPREFSLGDRAELAEMGDLVVNVIEHSEFDASALRAGL